MQDNEITKVLYLPKEFYFKNGILNLDALIESSEFQDAKVLDFSGIETSTDVLFWNLSSILASKKFDRDNLDYFLLNGCANVSIWTLHYLNSFNGRNLFSIPTTKVLSNYLKNNN